MRFIDSNIFLHAFLKPRRRLTKEEQRVKDEAKAVVERVEGGEEVALSTVHLSEVVNIIEAGLGLQRSLGFLGWVVTRENIRVYPTAMEDYERAMPLARERGTSVNDALTLQLMKRNGLVEIYSFDKHFDQLKDVIRLPGA